MRGQTDLGAVERITLRDQNLRTHDVDVGHDLGDGVLDLDARVHLDEEPRVAVHVVEELDGSGVVVAGARGQTHGGIEQFPAHLRVEGDGGRNFDHFLMTPLHRTIAVVKVDDVSVPVAQNLHLDVLGPPDELFQKHRCIAKGPQSLVLRLVEQAFEVGLLLHHAHAASATAEGRLDDERESDLPRQLEGLAAVLHRIVRARQGGHAQAFRLRAGRHFVAHQFEALRFRPDKKNPLAGAGPGEFGILREKAVARMDRIDRVFLRRRHHPRDVEIGTDRTPGLRQHVGLVGLEAMNAEPVLLGKNGHGTEVQFGGGAKDPDGNFAAVGGHQFADGPDGGGFRRGLHGSGLPSMRGGKVWQPSIGTHSHEGCGTNF